MRIGIDTRVLGLGRALSRYTRNLVSEFLRIGGNDYYFYLFSDSEENISTIENVDPRTAGKNYSISYIPSKLVVRDHLFFADFLSGLNLDVFFHPDNLEFLRCHRNSISTIHDVLPWKFPEEILSRNPIIRMKQELYFKLQRKALREKSKKIITVSQNSKGDIVEFLGIPSERVEVIYEGVENSFMREENPETTTNVRRKYRIDGQYLLYLGGFETYKNVTSLIRAFGQVYTHNLKLVIGGAKDSNYERLKAAVIKLGMEEVIIFPGFIEEKDLPAVYSGAVYTVYPSKYEGFGFPPLESMACGTPVIISGTSSLPEVGGDVAFYFDPNEENSIAGSLTTALKLFVEDPVKYKNLSEMSVLHSKRFDWRVTAEKTLDLFSKLI